MKIERPILIIIIFLIALLLFFFLVSPEYKKFDRLRTELGEKKAEFNAKFDYYAQITRLYYELQNRKEDLEKIDEALPQESDLGRIVYFLQRSSQASGLIIRNLLLSKTTKSNLSDQLKSIVFSVDAIGSYSSLLKFLEELERSGRIFEITNISFTGETASQISVSQPGIEPYQLHSFNLQIQTYSY